MAYKQISLTFPEQEFNRINEEAKKKGFKTIQRFIKFLIYEYLSKGKSESIQTMQTAQNQNENEEWKELEKMADEILKTVKK